MAKEGDVSVNNMKIIWLKWQFWQLAHICKAIGLVRAFIIMCMCVFQSFTN